MIEGFEELRQSAIYACLATVGGFVSYACNNTEFSWKTFFIKGLASGFTGMLIGLLCIYYSLNPSITYCICGTFGYIGSECTIALLKKVIVQKVLK